MALTSDGMNRKTTHDRKEEIKQAVLKIIKESGIKAVSTKRLAAEIGLSEGAIFRHFEKKSDIIRSIVDDVAQDLIGNLKEIAESDLPPREKLEKYLCTTINYLLENNGITILLLSEATYNNDSGMLDKLRYIFNAQRRYFEQIIRQGIDLGIWRPDVKLNDVSLLYMGIPITLNTSIVLGIYPFDRRHFCKDMIGQIERLIS